MQEHGGSQLMKKGLWGRLGSTAADIRGSAAVVFGVSALPMMALVGGSVDYARVAATRAQAQAAADAAVLAAGAQAKKTQADRQTAALKAARAAFGANADSLSLSVVESDVSSNTWQVTVSGSMKTMFGKFIGKSEVAVAAIAQATNSGASASKPLEIALALDNTGSMSNNMADLKSAAKTLVQNVMGGGGNSVRVSVVPYVAVVNPGLTDPTSVANYIDTTSVNPWNGVWYSGIWLTYNSSCNPYWGPPSGGGGGGGGGSSGAGTGGTGDARDILDILNPIRRMAQELFGVSAAHAADVTPATAPPTTGAWKSPNSGITYTIPVGFPTVSKDQWGQYSTGGCDWLANPETISQYELFKRIKDQNGQTVQWKGCVEARIGKTEQQWLNGNWGYSYAASRDYDLTDTAPTTGDPASLFTPYFWPDEPDYSPWTWNYVAPGAYSSSTKGFHNNYLPDGALPTAWGWRQLEQIDWSAGRRILKYDGTTRANIQETPDAQGFTYGPNAGCPDPVQRLTNNQGQVISKIEGLKYWQSGGTIISEGLMWAWRTLSPNAPYSDGAAYNTPGVSKVVVLMTDGVNELIDNGNNGTGYNTDNVSDYSAYGYMGDHRLSDAYGVSTYAGFNTLMNNRLQTACTNAKAAGIKIYTVVFNHGGYLTSQQQTDAQNLLKSCASSPSNSFVATDTSSLTAAFSAIGSSALGSGALRLIR
jgi:Flp pilus assembly protein TadG